MPSTSFCTIDQILNEVKRKEASHLIIVSLILHFHPLYFQPVPLQFNPKFDPISNNERLSLRSFKKQTSSSGKESSKSKGMESFKGNLILQGMSSQATDLTSKSKRTGTSSNEESAKVKFAGWCGQRVDSRVWRDWNSLKMD